MTRGFPGFRASFLSEIYKTVRIRDRAGRHRTPGLAPLSARL